MAKRKAKQSAPPARSPFFIKEGAAPMAMPAEVQQMTEPGADDRRTEGGVGASSYPVFDEDDTDSAGREQYAAAEIGEDEVIKAAKILKKYKTGKATLDARIISNEEWYRLRHWSQMKKSQTENGDEEYASAWLFNVLINKHADAMDNIPEPCILPREESDQDEAKKLSAIIPVVMEQCQYPQVYSDMWWQKLKSGTGITGVYWDPTANNGVGDIRIRPVDILNAYWEPGVTDIQASPHFFTVSLDDKEALTARYPELRGKLTGGDMDVKTYVHDDTIDTSEKAAVVDWYYKRTLPDKRTVVHMCKFVGNTVLYASENDPKLREHGFYNHGKYPFVFDALFKEEGTPAGFGYLDICKDAQIQIDKMNQVIVKNALIAARPRWFVRGDGSINEEEYADWKKDFVHVQGSGNPKDNIMQIPVNALPSIYVSILDQKVNELKEVSGNRDFAQGGTTGGVTAASAIASLQEAGNKLSRDMNSSAYRAYEQVCQLVIELIRQFYSAPRCFRITGDNGSIGFTRYDNANLAPGGVPGTDADMSARLPIFDIKVKSQKRSPFATAVENERAKELYGMGFFNPQAADAALAALDMMTFEGKDKIVQGLQERNTMIKMLQEKVQQLSRIVDAQNGTTIEAGIMGAMGGDGAAPSSATNASPSLESNQLGAARSLPTSMEGTARTRAAAASTPKI